MQHVDAFQLRNHAGFLSRRLDLIQPKLLEAAENGLTYVFLDSFTFPEGENEWWVKELAADRYKLPTHTLTVTDTPSEVTFQKLEEGSVLMREKGFDVELWYNHYRQDKCLFYEVCTLISWRYTETKELPVFVGIPTRRVKNHTYTQGKTHSADSDLIR